MRSALALVAAMLAGEAAAQGGLAPYQMVRSLQLVQDRIADGDHAAMPMQRRMLDMIDERLRRAESEELADARNLASIFIYAMSGGNPTTFEVALSKASPNEAQAALGKGVGSYLRGDLASARDMLAEVPSGALSPDLAASLALVRGTILAGSDATAARGFLEEALLLAPGTLIEEAALRRLVVVSVKAEDVDTFLSVANRYVRRFLRSPYASQFAESFVSGIPMAARHADPQALGDILDWMSAEHRENIVMRVSRQAGLENDTSLSDFMRQAAPAIAERDPRALLYTNLTSIGKADAASVLEDLSRVDRTQLSARDKALLDAAQAVARDVVEPAAADVNAAPSPEPLADAASVENSFVSSTRAKLEAIDQLLEGTSP